METIHVSHVSRSAAHLEALARIRCGFSHAIKAAVSPLTPTFGAPVEAFYQQLTGALPLTPAHLSLVGVGACVRWRLVEAHVKPTLSSPFSTFLPLPSNGTLLFAEIAVKTSILNSYVTAQSPQHDCGQMWTLLRTTNHSEGI